MGNLLFPETQYRMVTLNSPSFFTHEKKTFCLENEGMIIFLIRTF